MTDTERLPIAPARLIARETWRAAGRPVGAVVTLSLVFLGAAAAGIVPSLALGAIVDIVSTGGDVAGVWIAGAVMAGAIVVAAALSSIGLVGASVVLETTLATLRERMVATALHLPQRRVERAGTGDLVSRATDDVAEIAEAIPNVVPALTGSLFTIVMTFAGMAVIDPRFLLALVVILPIHVYAVRRYLSDAPPLYARERAAMADRAQHLLEALGGIETVRAFDLSATHGSRIARASWEVVRWSMRARAVQNAFFARLNAAEYAGVAVLLIAGFLLVQNGGITVGGATAAVLLFLRLFGPINELLFVIDDMQSALASLARIIGVVSMGQATDARAARTAGIEVSGVGYSYHHGHPVLSNVDLEVAPGESVAVVGESGAGKSTLAALVAGVHEATEGTIAAPADIVLVTQETHVFEGTLRDNLTLVRHDADDGMLRDALRVVDADPLLRRLAASADGADPLDRPVSATTLTPAEAQQIALARVALADPSAVVLDEATAEAGSSDAVRLERAAASVVTGRTAIVVAHRLDQARTAGRVLVLEAGEPTELGTHDELVLRGGRYAELWEAWQRPRG